VTVLVLAAITILVSVVVVRAVLASRADKIDKNEEEGKAGKSEPQYGYPLSSRPAAATGDEEKHDKTKQDPTNKNEGKEKPSMYPDIGED